MTHSLTRTSPKGKDGKFIGTCIKCGEKNLPPSAALKPCPMDPVVSNEEALLSLME